jgi:hypothetical protein
MVPTPKVRALAEAAMDAGNWREMDRGDNPTRGALVPLSKLVAETLRAKSGPPC